MTKRNRTVMVTEKTQPDSLKDESRFSVQHKKMQYSILYSNTEGGLILYISYKILKNNISFFNVHFKDFLTSFRKYFVS